MVYFYRSPQAIVISALCSIAIAAFIYFVIVKPETDKANDTVKQSLQQSQPTLPDVQKLGLQIGTRVPDFTLLDQKGESRTLASLMGPKGLMLVFFRSADW